MNHNNDQLLPPFCSSSSCIPRTVSANGITPLDIITGNPSRANVIPGGEYNADGGRPGVSGGDMTIPAAASDSPLSQPLVVLLSILPTDGGDEVTGVTIDGSSLASVPG